MELSIYVNGSDVDPSYLTYFVVVHTPGVYSAFMSRLQLFDMIAALQPARINFRTHRKHGDPL